MATNPYPTFESFYTCGATDPGNKIIFTIPVLNSFQDVQPYAREDSNSFYVVNTGNTGWVLNKPVTPAVTNPSFNSLTDVQDFDITKVGYYLTVGGTGSGEGQIYTGMTWSKPPPDGDPPVVRSFTELLDTFSSYTNRNLAELSVNTIETGLQTGSTEWRQLERFLSFKSVQPDNTLRFFGIDSSNKNVSLFRDKSYCMWQSVAQRGINYGIRGYDESQCYKTQNEPPETNTFFNFGQNSFCFPTPSSQAPGYPTFYEYPITDTPLWSCPVIKNAQVILTDTTVNLNDNDPVGILSGRNFKVRVNSYCQITNNDLRDVALNVGFQIQDQLGNVLQGPFYDTGTIEQSQPGTSATTNVTQIVTIYQQQVVAAVCRCMPSNTGQDSYNIDFPAIYMLIEEV